MLPTGKELVNDNDLVDAAEPVGRMELFDGIE
jgi:hypothetical protein